MTSALLLAFFAASSTGSSAAIREPHALAHEIIERSELKGGLCVLIPAADGRLETALTESGPYLVHGLSRDRKAVAETRRRIEARATVAVARASSTSRTSSGFPMRMDW
jgi:hypothetical protein